MDFLPELDLLWKVALIDLLCWWQKPQTYRGDQAWAQLLLHLVSVWCRRWPTPRCRCPCTWPGNWWWGCHRRPLVGPSSASHAQLWPRRRACVCTCLARPRHSRWRRLRRFRPRRRVWLYIFRCRVPCQPEIRKIFQTIYITAANELNCTILMRPVISVESPGLPLECSWPCSSRYRLCS